MKFVGRLRLGVPGDQDRINIQVLRYNEIRKVAV